MSYSTVPKLLSYVVLTFAQWKRAGRTQPVGIWVQVNRQDGYTLLIEVHKIGIYSIIALFDDSIIMPFVDDRADPHRLSAESCGRWIVNLTSRSSSQLQMKEKSLSQGYNRMLLRSLFPTIFDNDIFSYFSESQYISILCTKAFLLMVHTIFFVAQKWRFFNSL